MPPCGAIKVQPNAMESAPARPEPMMQAGRTWIGSAAANGIAPSVMKASPMMKLVGPDSLSSFVNLSLNSRVASAIAHGGTIPPIKLTGVHSGFVLCAASTGLRSLQKNLETLLFPFNAFSACIVSRLFARVNTAGTFLCGLLRLRGILCAVAAQSVQNAALTLQRKAVFGHQMGPHFVHEVCWRSSGSRTEAHF